MRCAAACTEAPTIVAWCRSDCSDVEQAAADDGALAGDMRPQPSRQPASCLIGVDQGVHQQPGPDHDGEAANEAGGEVGGSAADSSWSGSIVSLVRAATADTAA